MYKKIMWAVVGMSFLLVYACKNNGNQKFHVSGTFKNGAAGKVTLLIVQTGKDQLPVTLDSAKLTGENGSFSLHGKGGSQEIYELVFGDNVPVPLINDAAEITVQVDLSKKNDYYEVSGSPASSELREMVSGFGKKNYAVEKAFADMDSLKRQSAPDSVLLEATRVKNNTLKDLNDYLKKYIENASSSTLSTLALGWASRSFSTLEFETELTMLVKKYPDYKVLSQMRQEYFTQKAQAAEMASKSADKNTWVGKQAPDLVLPDVNGKLVSLSSFKGKFLLVDFWASWCGPCREENPNVVTAFENYKNKNFTILGVSLDKEKEAWQTAIQEDKLAWTQVSDLKYWDSKAVGIFGFQGIPFNILVDPTGKIIAQELRGSDLENKLKEVLQ